MVELAQLRIVSHRSAASPAILGDTYLLHVPWHVLLACSKSLLLDQVGMRLAILRLQGLALDAHAA